MTLKNRTLPRKKGGVFLTGRAAFFYTYNALQKHSCRALRQNGGYCDRQKADFIFTGAAGSRISVHRPLPLRGVVAEPVGDHGVCGVVRVPDDLQLL